MTPEAFSQSVIARRQIQLKKIERLRVETTRHWGQITARTYDFGRNERVANCLAELTLDDMLNFHDRYLAIGGPERCKIAGWAHGAKAKTCDVTKEDGGDAQAVAAEDGAVTGGKGAGMENGGKGGKGHDGQAQQEGSLNPSAALSREAKKQDVGEPKIPTPNGRLDGKGERGALRIPADVVEREVVMIEDYDHFRRSMPLFPISTSATVGLTM